MSGSFGEKVLTFLVHGLRKKKLTKRVRAVETMSRSWLESSASVRY
jgi:hypothetical protein